MVHKAFDNDKYLQMQSEHIRQRIAQFGGKLYLEFGGKLYDDNHASRVLSTRQQAADAFAAERPRGDGHCHQHR